MTFHATAVQKKLEDAGFDAKLAYGLTAVLEADIVRDLQDRLVTKEYLDLTKEYLDTRLETKLAELKAEMIKWMVGLVGGSTLAILVALFRLSR